MTRTPTYREKGRAVFLAALMTLSVVAISASFAGAAAAVNEETYDKGPTFDDGNIDEVYIGQEITLVDSDESQDGQFVAIAEGPEPQDDPETVSGTTEEVDGDTVTFETDNLEDNDVYHIYAYGDAQDEFDFHGEAFRAQTENLDIEFESSTVTDDGSVNLEIGSDRDSQHVNVTSPDFDADELEGIFGSEHAHPTDDEDAILLEDVSDGDQIEANFSDVSVEPGEYEFEFDVTDSFAEDNATVEVLDADQELTFNSVDQIEEGGIANVTIGVEHADRAAVVFGDEGDGHITEFEVDMDYDDADRDEVTLQFNSHTAADEDENYGWSAYDDENVTIENVNANTELNEDEPLPEHRWDLSVGESLSSDEFELENEHDRAVLQISAPSAIGNASAHVAPTNTNINNFEDYEDATVTETDTVADQDQLFLVVEDYGADGAIEAGYDEGIYVELKEQNSGPISGASSWNSSDELNVDLINQDDYNGDLIYAVDYQSVDGIEAGNNYYLTFTVTEENAYVDDEDEEIEQQLDLSLEEREVNWDAIASLPAQENATATGTTNIAPGTELDASADSPNDQGSFVDYTEAEVTEGNSPNEFAATFDLSGEESGVLFDIEVEDPYSDASDTVEDVELTEDNTTVATFEVDANAPSEVEVGDDATLDVTIENVGDLDGTSNYSVLIDGEQVDEGELELNSSESIEKSYEFDTSAEGDIEWEVATDHDDDSGTLSVTDGEGEGAGEDEGESEGESEGAGEDEGEGGDDDSTPGFGVAVAAVALLAAAMLALRQQH